MAGRGGQPPGRAPAPAPDPAFAAAVAALRATRLRADVVVEDVPPPARIAPHAVALAGDVVLGGTPGGDVLATGRFVLLHDPAAPEEWGGTFRVVSYARADLEADLGADPLLGQVGWSWLREALDDAGAGARALGGTATRVLSEGYGDLADREPSVDLELRASWTPEDPADVGAHLSAWSRLLCSVAGLPPLPEGVAALHRLR